MRLIILSLATLLAVTLGQNTTTTKTSCPGKADIVIALDIETDAVQFVFMREYVKRFLQSIALNDQTGSVVSILAYGINTMELSDFTASKTALETALDSFNLPRPINQRNTSMVVEKIIEKFQGRNRPGVPRIAMTFVSGNTDGNYQLLKTVAKNAAFEHNIVTVAISSNKTFAIRDLDVLTQYISGRIISTDYRPAADFSDMANLVPVVCKHMVNGRVTFKNCTGKAHIVVAIDLQTQSRFASALNFASALFWYSNQIRRTLLINDAGGYEQVFPPGSDSIRNFSSLLNESSTRLNSGNYNAAGMIDRIASAYTPPTTMHTVRVAVLISDQDSGTTTQMRQKAELLRNLNIRLIIVGIQSTYNPSLSTFLSLNDGTLMDRIVVTDQTFLSSGMSQILDASCDAITKCPGGLDMMIAMDSSYSINDLQFQQVKEYTKIIANSFVNNKVHATQLAIIAFGENVTHVSFFGDKTIEIFENINNYVKSPNDFKTNIDFAVTNMTTMMNSFGRTGVPKVSITATDGKSTRGLVNLQRAAKAAASNNVITMAVGIGDGYVMEELTNITNGIMSNIFQTSFDELSGVIAQQTIDRLCLFSIEGKESDRICDGKAHITIGIDVSDLNFQSAKLFANNLISHLQVQPDMMISLIIGSTGLVYNFPPDTESSIIRNTILSATNSDATVYNHTGTLQRIENTFASRPTMPRIALFVTDGKGANTASSISTARQIATKDIKIISIGIIRNNPNSVDMNEIIEMAGNIIQNRFVISEEGLLSSGINQVVDSVCLAISEWTGTELMKYMGPAEISLTFDSCDSTMYNFYRAFTSNVVRYVNVEENVKFNAASFCSNVEPVTSYKDIYYIHPSIEYSNVIGGKFWTATDIIGDYIQYFSSIRSSNKFGIVIINDSSFEKDLKLMAEIAFQQGITLLPLGIEGLPTMSMNLQTKLSMINPDIKELVNLNRLNVGGTTFLIANLAQMAVAGERHIAIGLVGRNMFETPANQYTQYNHVITMLQNNTQYVNGDIRGQLNAQIGNVKFTSVGLAIHDAIRVTREQFAGQPGQKHMFIIVNRGPEYPDLVQRQLELAKKENITIYAIGYLPDVSLEQLVNIAGDMDRVSFYQDSNQLIQFSAKFIQLLNNNMTERQQNLAFAIAGNGISPASFIQVRNVVSTGVSLYSQLASLSGKDIAVTTGMIGYDGYYVLQPLGNINNLNRTIIETTYNILTNEPLAHSLMNQYLTLMENRVSGRPQYAVVFYNGPISNKETVLKIANMMRESGITVIPYHINGVTGGTSYTDTVEYKDALDLAGGIASHVFWIPKTSIDAGSVDPVEISSHLKNGIMNIGNYGGNIDVNMGMVGDLDTNSLKWIRRIIAAFIGTSAQLYENTLKLGVFEFDHDNMAQLIHFGMHSDYNKLMDAFQAENTLRINYPQTDASLQYIMNSISQGSSSNEVKVGVVLMDDATFSRYVTSGLAYQAYASGIYILPMRVSQSGSTLTEFEMIELANGVSGNTYTIDDVAKLNTDGLVWLINKLHSLVPLVPVLTSLPATTTTTPTTTTPTTTTTSTTTTTPSTTTSVSTVSTPSLQECKGPADIVFALDSSDSLNTDDFADSKEFVKALIDNMLVGPDNIRVRSVFTFSSTLKNISYDVYDKALMKVLIDQATMLKVGTNTHLAIEEIIRIHTNSHTNPKFGIIITDGLSASPNATQQMSILAAQQGITLIAVGIIDSKYTEGEKNTMKLELDRIVNYVQGHRFTVTDFNQMVQILPDLNSLICTLATTTPITTTTTAPTTTQPFSNECITKCPSIAIRCWIPHPTECKYYLDCIKEAGDINFVKYTIQECGMHEFFNPAKGECDHLDEFVCATDPCVLNNWDNGTTYAIPNTCDKYYKCLYSPDDSLIHTRQACQCEYKTKYNTGTHSSHDTHCVPDTNNECSIVIAEPTITLIKCTKTPSVAINAYYQNGIEVICPLGQIYKPQMCNCDWGNFPTPPPVMTSSTAAVTAATTPGSGQGCSSIIDLDFAVIPSNHYQIQGSEQVQIANGEAYFGGNNHIANPQLNGNIATKFVANVSLRFDSSSVNGLNSIAIMKSCDGDPRWSIEMYAEVFPSKLHTTVRFADINVDPVVIINDKYDMFQNDNLNIRLGFNKQMVTVEVYYSDGKVDRQQKVVGGVQDFRVCNGDLSFGKQFGSHSTFIGYVKTWEVFNRCDVLPPNHEELFT